MPTRSITLVLLTGAVGLGLLQTAYSQTPGFDLVIRGGRVVDGTGSPWFLADVGIKGDTIVAVAPRLDAGGARVIDAQGLVVSPGFIDVHSHVEAGDEGQDIDRQSRRREQRAAGRDDGDRRAGWRRVGAGRRLSREGRCREAGDQRRHASSVTARCGGAVVGQANRPADARRARSACASSCEPACARARSA